MQKYYQNVISTHLLEKQLVSYRLNMQLIVSGTISNYKNKQSILRTIYVWALLTGQRVQCTNAKKSVAVFQLKKKALLGYKLTLRKFNLFEFLFKLNLTYLPRIQEDLIINSKKRVSFGVTKVTDFPETDYQYHLFQHDFGCNFEFSNYASKLDCTSYLILSHLQLISTSH
uniref:Ribosomal protein L5 n=1 Tax=Tsukubamonas globosa TaxID=875863 RepID=W8VJU9_9EUKA|nr:ribosomal protein L5 [Tsukubamonas globosa]BAO51955.1 ribosomal protein L5 [Tsukubamonas globosa]